MSIVTKNKFLAGAYDSIERQLTPDTKGAFEKIVTAGMQAALNNGLQGMLGGLEKRGDPIRDAAQGAVNLVFMLRMQATGQMPEQAMVPASYALMLQALAFIEEAGISKVGQPELEKATRVWTNTIFDRFKISPGMLNRAKEAVDAVLNDPGKVEQLNLATGYSRDPRAPQPMGEMPQAKPMNRRERRKARAGRR